MGHRVSVATSQRLLELGGGGEVGGHQKDKRGEFPGGPVVRAPSFHCAGGMGHGFHPWLGN